MYVACSTLCLARLPFEDAVRAIRDLHFQKVDLAIRQTGPHLTPADVAADVNKLVAKLKSCTVGFAAIYCGPYDLSQDPDAKHFRAVCRLARLMAIPTITVGTADAATLHPLNRACVAEGIQLAVETTHADVAAYLALCKAVPGLKLTLDPSYFVDQNAALDSLLTSVCHVRLRDSGKGPEQFQMKVGQGEVDFGRIISNLERVGYDRCLTVDIRDVADGDVSVDSEVRKLKYLLESLI